LFPFPGNSECEIVTDKSENDTETTFSSPKEKSGKELDTTLKTLNELDVPDPINGEAKNQGLERGEKKPLHKPETNNSEDKDVDQARFQIIATESTRVQPGTSGCPTCTLRCYYKYRGCLAHYYNLFLL